MEELHKIVKKRYKEFDITSQHLGQVIRDNNITRKRTRHDPEKYMCLTNCVHSYCIGCLGQQLYTQLISKKTFRFNKILYLSFRCNQYHDANKIYV